jgi:outer membrane protein
MKKIVLILSVVCSFSLNAQSKMAHVDSQRLLDSLPSYNKAEQELQKFQEDGLNDLAALEKQLSEAYQKLDAMKDKLTPTMMKIEQEKVMALDQRYQQTQNMLKQQLQALQGDYMQPILNRLQTAIETVAVRKKIDYVLDVTNLLYSKTGVDITAEVKVELSKLDAEAMKKP